MVWPVSIIAALLGLFAVLNPFGAMLLVGTTIDAVTQDHRPALLGDAKPYLVGKSEAFRRRFARGTAEGELLAWLRYYRFEIRGAGFAEKEVYGGPLCREFLDVSWTAADGKILSAEAVVEHGCL
jgi:hypothetical protein